MFNKRSTVFRVFPTVLAYRQELSIVDLVFTFFISTFLLSIISSPLSGLILGIILIGILLLISLIIIG